MDISSRFSSPTAFETYHTQASQEMLAAERTATRAHYCCNAARLVFLVCHGLLVFVVSASLSHIDDADWWLLFLPSWIGYVLSTALLAMSWFVSCPYLRLCLHEKQPRVNDENPSILTEVLPEIVLTIPGFLLLLIAFVSEYSLCIYLDSLQKGRSHSLAATTVLFALTSMLTLCQGALFMYNSIFWLLFGAGLLGVAMMFAATQQPGCSAMVQAFAIVPALLSVAGLVAASIWRIRRYHSVLIPKEIALLKLESVLLLLLLLAIWALFQRIAQGQWRDAGWEGCLAGLLLCLLGVPRARLCVLEAYRGHFEDRLFLAQAESHTSTRMTSSAVSESAMDRALTASENC